MKKYIVCWVTEKASTEMIKLYKDHYRVFIDGNSRENLGLAEDFYERLLNKNEVYSANICEIIKSTDYK